MFTAINRYVFYIYLGEISENVQPNYHQYGLWIFCNLLMRYWNYTRIYGTRVLFDKHFGVINLRVFNMYVTYPFSGIK